VHVKKSDLTGVLLPVPPLVEQASISNALRDVNGFIQSLEQLLVKKRRVKQGAMQELLTGKKRLPGFSENWEEKRLGEIVDTDPENLGSETRSDYRFKYISLEDVDTGTLRSHSEQVFRKAPSRARRKLRRNDVLVSTVRPNLKSHLLFLDDSPDWVCSTGFSVLRCKAGVSNAGYIYFHMFADTITRQIEALLTGSNYPAINSRDVRALKLPVPNYEEQAAIATVLSDISAEISAIESKIVKASSIRQGMMQELLTGRIRLV
jgi:type I restriction enzyme S subunit